MEKKVHESALPVALIWYDGVMSAAVAIVGHLVNVRNFNNQQEAMMKNLTLLVLLTSVMLLAACNTMEGLGKDVSKLGNKIEKKAEEKKN